jgi:hypothetical protein
MSSNIVITSYIKIYKHIIPTILLNNNISQQNKSYMIHHYNNEYIKIFNNNKTIIDDYDTNIIDSSKYKYYDNCKFFYF